MECASFSSRICNILRFLNTRKPHDNQRNTHNNRCFFHTFQFRLTANVILKTEVLVLGFLSVLSLHQERGHPSPTLYIKVYILYNV